jgi:hypothetical protein
LKISFADEKAVENYVVTMAESDRMASIAKQFIKLIENLSTDNLIEAFRLQRQHWTS